MARRSALRRRRFSGRGYEIVDAVVYLEEEPAFAPAAEHQRQEVWVGEYAIVANLASYAASEALYRSAGFEPWHVLDGDVQTIGTGRDS
jgi:hypothetical protein